MGKSPLSELVHELDPEEQHFELVRFLSEDLGHTNELLNLTDQKVALLIRLVSGLFVVIVTTILALMELGTHVFDTSLPLSWPGLIGYVVFGAFAWWLLLYSFRTIEMKQLYIFRMNFLRREIHYLLGTKNSSLIGYWTADKTENRDRDELTDTGQDEINAEAKDAAEERQKIGLDNLYPTGISAFLYGMVALVAISSINTTVGLSDFPAAINSLATRSDGSIVPWLILLGIIAVFTLALRRLIKKQWRLHRTELQDLEDKYSISSPRPSISESLHN